VASPLCLGSRRIIASQRTDDMGHSTKSLRDSPLKQAARQINQSRDHR
jgi:hypothetical protein